MEDLSRISFYFQYHLDFLWGNDLHCTVFSLSGQGLPVPASYYKMQRVPGGTQSFSLFQCHQLVDTSLNFES